MLQFPYGPRRSRVPLSALTERGVHYEIITEGDTPWLKLEYKRLSQKSKKMKRQAQQEFYQEKKRRLLDSAALQEMLEDKSQNLSTVEQERTACHLRRATL
jgi:hypothetical protein